MTHPNQELILEKEGIRRLKKDIRLVKRRELAKHFATKKGRIVLTKLIKSIIWQAYENIQAGTAPPIEGNIRTFWYLYVKPVLSHIHDDDNVKTDPYDTMLSMFSRMVMKLHLFRYADFDFTDENWENRRIGTEQPHILLFAEKRGWIRFLREQHERFGVSILALGGSPSALSSEYTAEAIQSLGISWPIQLIGIVDYDPSGYLIAQAFKKQLAQAGLVDTHLTTLIHPKHYTEEQLEMFEFSLPKRQPTKTQHWMKVTNGIDGRRFGLESESMPRTKLRTLLEQNIKPHLIS